MEYTRIKTEDLNTTVAKATRKVGEALDILKPIFPALTKSDRASLPKPPEAFDAKAREVIQHAKNHDALAEVAGFDGTEVAEDLDNVDALAPLRHAVGDLQQRIGDAELQWKAEAYKPALALYQMAKVRADQGDGEAEKLVKPLAEIFGLGRPRPRKAK